MIKKGDLQPSCSRKPYIHDKKKQNKTKQNKTKQNKQKRGKATFISASICLSVYLSTSKVISIFL